MPQLVLSLITVALLVYALVDIITCDSSRIRYLDKLPWAIIVILLPLVGSLLWVIIGKHHQPAVDRGGFGDPRRREQFASSLSDSGTEDDLARVEREIEFHEREARIRRLEAELDSRRALNTDAPESDRD